MVWQPRSWGEPGLGAAVVNVQRLELFPLLLLQFPSVSSPAGVALILAVFYTTLWKQPALPPSCSTKESTVGPALCVGRGGEGYVSTLLHWPTPQNERIRDSTSSSDV